MKELEKRRARRYRREDWTFYGTALGIAVGWVALLLLAGFGVIG